MLQNIGSQLKHEYFLPIQGRKFWINQLEVRNVSKIEINNNENKGFSSVIQCNCYVVFLDLQPALKENSKESVMCATGSALSRFIPSASVDVVCRSSTSNKFIS
jgi:hypothetical protein